MSKRFNVDVSPIDGYRFRLLSKNNVKNFSFVVDEVNCFNKKTDDDEIFIVSDSDLVFTCESCGDQEYQVGFQGWIELELSKTEDTLLKSVSHEVDYNFEILLNNEPLQQDSEYELVYNKRFVLSSCKS